MKKIISVLCIISLIAGLACISASAADPVVTVSLVTDGPTDGEGEFTADVVASLPEGGDVSQLSVKITVPAGLTLKGCDQVVTFGSFETSENLIIDPYHILWVSGTKSLPAGDTVIARLSFAAPTDIIGDAVYDIAIALDTDNLPATVEGVEYAEDDIVLVGASVTVKGKPAETTTTTASTPKRTTEPIYRPVYTGRHTTVVTVTDELGNAVTGPDGNPLTEMVEVTTGEITTRKDVIVIEVTDEHGSVVTDADGNAVTETVFVTDALAADTGTDAASGESSAATGDNAFIVVAVLVAALGCALIVRKVKAE